MNSQSFGSLLLKWNFNFNDRDLPWKNLQIPYLIWLSEILLQQTQAVQAKPYFLSFKKAFPTISDLANADENLVFKMWEGLGYYSRCRNLIFTAKYIHEVLHDIFPDNYNDLLKLKGIGPYTAAAIASLAYNEKVAVVDGNVIRVLSRYLGIVGAVDESATKKEINTLAQKLLSAHPPAAYNQAIMDFGATVCTPKKPLCNTCIFSGSCVAYNKGIVALLPHKAKKIIKKERYFNFVIATFRDWVLIKQRTEKDIWQNLYSFILMEGDALVIDAQEIISTLEKGFKTSQIIFQSAQTTQLLTHQKIHAQFLHINLKKKILLKDHFWVPIKALDSYAFPGTIKKFLLMYPHLQ